MFIFSGSLQACGIGRELERVTKETVGKLMDLKKSFQSYLYYIMMIWSDVFVSSVNE